MKPPAPFLVAAAFLLAGIAYYAAGANDSIHREALVIETRAGARYSFQVEIADTAEKHETGLMFREHMAPDEGMLFEMGSPIVTRFWMKNTLIPLDMIFVAQDGTIAKIHENAVPKSLDGISSDVPVSGVLELNGGQARALGVEAGDRVLHPYFSGSF